MEPRGLMHTTYMLYVHVAICLTLEMHNLDKFAGSSISQHVSRYHSQILLTNEIIFTFVNRIFDKRHGMHIYIHIHKYVYMHIPRKVSNCQIL